MAKFDGDSQKVMKLAELEARRFNHEYIGTEHVLLALVKDDSGFTAGVLKNLGLDPHEVVAKIDATIKPGPCPVVAGRLPVTPPFKRVVEHAIENARNLKHPRVEVPHLLLGLIHDDQTVAAIVLKNSGVTLEVFRSEVLRQLDETPPA